MPIRRNYNQNWLPSIFNDFFDNDWMEKANATAPAINVVENDNSYKIEVAAPGDPSVGTHASRRMLQSRNRSRPILPGLARFPCFTYGSQPSINLFQE